MRIFALLLLLLRMLALLCHAFMMRRHGFRRHQCATVLLRTPAAVGRGRSARRLVSEASSMPLQYAVLLYAYFSSFHGSAARRQMQQSRTAADRQGISPPPAAENTRSASLLHAFTILQYGQAIDGSPILQYKQQFRAAAIHCMPPPVFRANTAFLISASRRVCHNVLSAKGNLKVTTPYHNSYFSSQADLLREAALTERRACAGR